MFMPYGIRADDMASPKQRIAQTLVTRAVAGESIISTQVLAEFAALLARRPDADRFSRALPKPAQQDLAALVTRRRQLIAMLLSERQRMRLARPVARASIEATIEFLRPRTVAWARRSKGILLWAALLAALAVGIAVWSKG